MQGQGKTAVQSGWSSLPPGLDALCAELYAKSAAERYGITLPGFQHALARICCRFVPQPDAALADQFLRSLQIEDLVLAQGCAAGNEYAWEVFLTRFRERLYNAARAITRDEARGRELADSLYADLYGTRLRDGQRVSKLASYSGRGSLEGWLRAVLAQQFVNRYRAESRLVSLEEEQEDGRQFAAPAAMAGDTGADSRLDSAVDAALGELPAEDRMILASYFLDQRKLSEIGRMLALHESSISRRLDKITASLRKRVLHHLQASGMSRRQAEEALLADVRDVTVNVRARLQEQREENAAGP